ncbi:YktB family protein [Aquibacillus albus]|uniref:UPF0637 protein JOC48_002737 n=1 Tax=Aquibacillus albus TaxID=1168171 RepID=A0ABS2N299_9BACI|nr:DUF1054 domain-containing protein [Aquibacillus albus]MBM7572234.1 uncharacterized protein YktB (UPF0637 family) [Aquibacillus albus]
MAFDGFTKQDFETFMIDGLDERMEAIRERIQPKFQDIGTDLAEYLSMKLGNEMYLHIAKHARRSVNPPKDTWLAIANNKRGYKKHPHFQVGLFDDHVFIWLALIYELPNKSVIAKQLLEEYEALKKLPEDFVVSLDHTKKDSIPITELSQTNIERFRDVKKAEFLVGKHVAASDSMLEDGQAFLSFTKETIDQLIPYYQLALNANDN